MEKKPLIAPFLLGQLVATMQLLEEDVKSHDAPHDRSLTVTETYINDLLEEPESTLRKMEKILAPKRERMRHVEKKQLLHEMILIYKIKDQYDLDNERLDEDKFYQGYFKQMLKYYKED